MPTAADTRSRLVREALALLSAGLVDEDEFAQIVAIAAQRRSPASAPPLAEDERRQLMSTSRSDSESSDESISRHSRRGARRGARHGAQHAERRRDGRACAAGCLARGAVVLAFAVLSIVVAWKAGIVVRVNRSASLSHDGVAAAAASGRVYQRQAATELLPSLINAVDDGAALHSQRDEAAASSSAALTSVQESTAALSALLTTPRLNDAAIADDEYKDDIAQLDTQFNAMNQHDTERSVGRIEYRQRDPRCISSANVRCIMTVGRVATHE